MACPTRILRNDRFELVFTYIPEPMKVLAVGRRNSRIQFIRDHLVRAALHWQELARIVISQADIAEHVDAPLASFDDSRDQGLSVQIRGLDEDVLLRVPHSTQPCLVLRCHDAAVVGCSVRNPVYQSNRERLMRRVRNVRRILLRGWAIRRRFSDETF